MERNFIFALILLITLSTVNAIPANPYRHKETTTFGKCPKVASDIATLSVSVSPDPLVPNKNNNFTVSGTLNYDIDAITVILISFNNKDGSEPIGSEYSSVICTNECSIPAGTKFSKTVEIKTPEDLPKSPDEYQAGVLVANPIPGRGGGVFGCAAHIPDS